MNSNSGDKKTRGDDADHRRRGNPQEGMELREIFLFGLIGATATTLLVSFREFFVFGSSTDFEFLFWFQVNNGFDGINLAGWTIEENS